MTEELRQFAYDLLDPKDFDRKIYYRVKANTKNEAYHKVLQYANKHGYVLKKDLGELEYIPLNIVVTEPIISEELFKKAIINLNNDNFK